VRATKYIKTENWCEPRDLLKSGRLCMLPMIDVSGYINQVVEVFKSTLFFLNFMIAYLIVLCFILIWLEFRRCRCRCGD
jgi:hypothetical protein